MKVKTTNTIDFIAKIVNILEDDIEQRIKVLLFAYFIFS